MYLEKDVSEALARHVARAYAAAPGLAPDMVLSHETAAVLHGLTSDASLVPSLLQVSGPSSGAGATRKWRKVHATRLPPEDVTTLSGVPITTVARTVVDCARTLPFIQAVPLADRLLRTSARPEEVRLALIQVADRLAGCKGVQLARSVIAFADAGAANGGESTVRVILSTLGLPTPIVQYLICDPKDPYFKAWVDFAWPDLHTVLEFDGLVKYRAGNPSGRPGHDVLISEKRREDQLRALGWHIVRITWSDLGRPEWIAVQLRQAFARGARG